jgi:hypothetical protein
MVGDLGNRATQGRSSQVGKPPEERVQYHVRDIENRRPVGSFESESVALGSLKGGPDGRFSINNHQGGWCEVLVRGGQRFVRHALMADGNPAAFLSIELESDGVSIT